jgi:hypothetical protein
LLAVLFEQILEIIPSFNLFFNNDCFDHFRRF